MKNIYILLLLCAVPCIAHAADTMCVKPTTTVVTLDPEINGSALSSAVVGKPWSVEFSYGIISGVGSCYSNVGATQGDVASDQNITPYTTGTHCYCKMLKPVESAWVYSGLYSAYACANNCASKCASNAGSAVALRNGMFGSITLL